MKSVKTPLKKTLGKAMLTGEEMRTTLTAVEAQINSLPLTYCSDDTGDPIPLTPAEIIFFFSHSNNIKLKRYKRC